MRCNIAHVHPWNAGGSAMHVRQTISLLRPDAKLLDGVQDFFETLVALSQQGRADHKGTSVGSFRVRLACTSFCCRAPTSPACHGVCWS
jgi:hypothetical protein